MTEWDKFGVAVLDGGKMQHLYPMAILVILQSSGWGAGQGKCLIPQLDGAILSPEWKEALWEKFVRGAPRPADVCHDMN